MAFMPGVNDAMCVCAGGAYFRRAGVSMAMAQARLPGSASRGRRRSRRWDGVRAARLPGAEAREPGGGGAGLGAGAECTGRSKLGTRRARRGHSGACAPDRVRASQNPGKARAKRGAAARKPGALSVTTGWRSRTHPGGALWNAGFLFHNARFSRASGAGHTGRNRRPRR